MRCFGLCEVIDAGNFCLGMGKGNTYIELSFN